MTKKREPTPHEKANIAECIELDRRAREMEAERLASLPPPPKLPAEPIWTMINRVDEAFGQGKQADLIAALVVDGILTIDGDGDHCLAAAGVRVYTSLGPERALTDWTERARKAIREGEAA